MTALAPIGVVTDVSPHPNSDQLDVVTVSCHDIIKVNVANRPETNTPRYAVGDFAVMLLENLILPENIIRHLHMWNDEKNKGGLAGSKGNRTKGRKVAEVMSDVALLPVVWKSSLISVETGDGKAVSATPLANDPIGYDMADLLHIKGYEAQ